MSQELTHAVIQHLYPNLNRGARKRLVKMALEKRAIVLDLSPLVPVLDNLLCSIIRHEATSYDAMLRATSRDRARCAVQPVIAARLNEAKGRKK